MYLIHVGPEPIHTVQEGRLYSFPPNEATEIKDDFIGKNILHELAITGITEVVIGKDGKGMPVFDVEGAKKQARQARTEGLHRIVDNYIKTQLEDRIRKNFPAMPPSTPVQKAIDELGIDIAKFGIRSFTSVSGNGEKGFATDERYAKQQEEIDQLKDAVSALIDQNKLLKAELNRKPSK